MATLELTLQYNTFLPQKLSLSKIFENVIACDLWFGPLPLIKNPDYTNAFTNHIATNSKTPLRLSYYKATTSRGGVEDTRLEAKATKKIRGQGQGQGQPFRGQTLSRPRTGMLEAKAKDQGHKAQVLSKKKKKRSSQKFFKRSPLKNVFQKIFQPLHKILTFQKIVLSSSRGQANF